jgi:hypothetical protein
MWKRRAGPVVLTMLALTSAVGRADDGRKGAPADPDPGFLEFLGSVDRLAETNPDYLAQAGRPAPPSPPAKGAATSVAPPPPPPPPTSASGVKNNDQ